MSKPILYIFVGYPGAGKTTAAEIIEKRTGAEHIWVDRERTRIYGNMYRREDSDALYAALNAQAAKLLEAGKSVIYDTNFGFYKDRQIMRDLAAAHGAQILLLWLCTDRETAKMRAVGDQSHEPTRHYTNMTANDFDRIANHLEEPRADEDFIEVYGVDLTEEVLKNAHVL